MYYLLITFSALIFALRFLINDSYQKECGSGWNSSLKFSLYTSIIGAIVLFVTNKFKFNISLFSIIVALIYAIDIIALNYFTVKALKSANLSLFSVFAMIGGMVLPFVYGVLCGEEFKILRIVCCAVIVATMMLTVDKNKKSGKALIYYVAVFVLNGMIGVISKFHQSYPEYCVGSADFLMIVRIITAVFSVFLIVISKQKSFFVSKKAFAFSSGSATLDSVANLLLLISLLHLPASVQYPIVTGGVIVFSLIIDLIRKAQVRKKDVFVAVVALASSILMAF